MLVDKKVIKIKTFNSALITNYLAKYFLTSVIKYSLVRIFIKFTMQEYPFLIY